jgi:hypothetical protein
VSLSTAAKETIISLDASPLAEITAMSNIQMAREIVDVTSFGAGIGRDRKLVLAAIVDVTMEMNFLSGNFSPLETHFQDGTTGAFLLTLAGSLGVFNFDAFVTIIEPVIDYETIIKANVTLGVDINRISYTP